MVPTTRDDIDTDPNPRLLINTTLPSNSSLHRGSSSSRSTSAIIYTPLEGSSTSLVPDNIKMPLPLPEGESSGSIRRVGSQERTRSWIEERVRDSQLVQAEGVSEQDEMGYLKPPGASRRSSLACKSSHPTLFL